MAEPLVQLWNYLSAFDKWLITTVVGGVSAVGGYLYRAVKNVLDEVHHANTNCLPTIQKNTGETRDAILANSSKMDVLISIIEKKL